MACVSLERHLDTIEEALHEVVRVRDASEVAHCEL